MKPSLVTSLLLTASLSAQTDSIADVVRDGDGDFFPDRLGEIVVVEGKVTTPAHSAVRPQQARIYIEDATAGIRLVAPRMRVLDRFELGSRLRATGTLQQHQGMPMLEIDRVERIGFAVTRVEPRKVRIRDLHSETICGQLVRVRGTLVEPPADVLHRFWIADESDRIRLFLRRTLFEDPDLPPLTLGDQVEIEGVAEQYDVESTPRSGYRLTPMAVTDVRLQGVDWLSWIAPISVFVMALVSTWFVMRSRRAEQRWLAAPVEAQKLQALGTLAGGIAHEFNNYLGSITGLAELTLLEVGEDSRSRESLQRILDASARAKQLTDRILAYARASEDSNETANFGEAVRTGSELLRATMSSSVQFDVQIDGSLGQAPLDSTQLQQVLLNLGANAAHAMRDTEPRELRIAAQRVTVGKRDAQRLNLDVEKSAEFAMLTVGDTGQGMSAKTLARIYEPFYTTKQAGEGTGLGLSLVHSIVQRSRGAMEVQSELGRGSTFRVYLPIVQQTSRRQPDTPKEVDGIRVLFVDDDPQIQSASCALLEQLGYRITGFNDPEEAWSAFERAPDDFDVLITDHKMPNLVGTELGRRIHRVRAELPIIMITGHFGSIDAKDRETVPLAAVIEKPFRSAKLANAIESVVGPPPAGGDHS